MPDMSARLERLNALFGVELSERIERVRGLVRELEQGAKPATLGEIGRQLHSLTGAAQAVAANAVEDASRTAEEVVARAREGHVAVDHDWFGALRAAVDVIPASVILSDAKDPLHQAASREADSSAAPQNDTPPKPAPVAATRETPAAAAEPTSVRVSLAKLDALLTDSGELSVTNLRIKQRLKEARDVQHELERLHRDWTRGRPARARFRRGQAHSGAHDTEALLRADDRFDQQVQAVLQRTRELVRQLAQNTGQLSSVADAIGEEVMAIRLLPVGTILRPLDRLVRDLAVQTGKDMRLVVEGTETEIDRRVLDELRDPFMHMVRNTIDHGMEPAEVRLAAGKPAQGTLRLAAVQRGDRVQIVVEDDGRGIDVEGIRATAVRRNLVTAERAETMDSAALIDLIFQPGFSTATTVSGLSGRGVGMDVVRDRVTRLGGEIGVRTTPGVGTTFTITVPLTLATTRVLLVQDGGHIYAVPSSHVERTGRVRTAELGRLEGRAALQIDGRAVPVIELRQVLDPQAGAAIDPTEWRPFFLLGHGERTVAVLTDRLNDETELVLKPLAAPLVRVRHVAGAAVLSTGAVVVILNAAEVFKSALANLDLNAPRPVAPVLTSSRAAKQRQRVLVVDDSVMTRTLERTILETAGYIVVVASDGAQALQVLAETDVDAIVSDVEMPRMDGLQLTQALRQQERWQNLPVVLVTSLDAPEHLERGAAAGADAYIVKGRFDQNDLISTLERLL